MESFLKYLRGGAVAGNQRAPVAATTIAESVCEDGGGGGGDVDDDASFFDLEFAVHGDDSAAEEAERVEFNFADVASETEVVAVDAESKKDDVGGGSADSEVAVPPPASVPLRPAATKLRVLMLKLRNKPNNKVAVPAEGNGGAAAAAKTSNRFLIKFRVDDNNTSRASEEQEQQPQAEITAEERRFAKEVVLKYLNKMKPLYVKVSRLRFHGAGSEGEETDAEPEPSSPAPSPSPAAAGAAPPQPQPVVVACGVRAPRASVPAGLKQACKRLGKSRSASSAVAAAPPPTPPAPQRRDDSLLQLQDGIQSAIAHCKRSFNASKGCESPLLRSMTMTVGGDAAPLRTVVGSDPRSIGHEERSTER